MMTEFERGFELGKQSVQPRWISVEDRLPERKMVDGKMICMTVGRSSIGLNRYSTSFLPSFPAVYG